MPSKKRHRPYKSGVPQHVYFKGIHSFGIFYEREDHLYFLTLFFCLARKYDISVLAFCIMFNHVHHASVHQSRTKLSRFQQELESTFAKEYNKSRNTAGNLFKKEFGSVPKSVGKSIATTILYILYNPKAGGLVKKASEYRWNLIAYYDCQYPFSKKVDRSTCPRRMRRAMELVDSFRKENKPLKYRLLSLIFSGLGEQECEQMTDYIISTYNQMDYDGQISYFGTFSRMNLLLESTMPKEYDLKEDWDDYSQYARMLEAIKEEMHGRKALFFPGRFSDTEKRELAGILFSECGGKRSQVMKFLHIMPGT